MLSVLLPEGERRLYAGTGLRKCTDISRVFARIALKSTKGKYYDS